MTTAVRCAGAIVFDATGRLLLIRRGTPPSRGSWSVPGGRCRPGETAEHACVREVAEETGLSVTIDGVAGRVERPGLDGAVYDITDFACALVGGRLRAGDDADDARWVTRAEFDRLPLVPLLGDTLREWGYRPRC